MAWTTIKLFNYLYLIDLPLYYMFSVSMIFIVLMTKTKNVNMYI